MFYISYAKTRYDIVSTDNLKILLLNSDHENEYRLKKVLKGFYDKENKIHDSHVKKSSLEKSTNITTQKEEE